MRGRFAGLRVLHEAVSLAAIAGIVILAPSLLGDGHAPAGGRAE